MKRVIIAIALLGSAALCGTVLAYVSPGKPTGHVNDFAGVMVASDVSALEQELINFKKETSREVAVAIVPTIGDEAIENYSNLLFREWGVGDKNLNNGVLFVVAVNDRKMRIEVGYGLEGALTDVESKYILNEIATPYFKAGHYSEGVVAAIQKIKEAVRGEAVPANYTGRTSALSGTNVNWRGLLYLVLFVGWILGLSKYWWLGGVVGGMAGFIAWWSFAFGWYFIPLGVFIGLFIDFIFSSGGFGGIFPSGGFGGDFGGFGGGSSGGGGSSSRW